MSGDGCRFSLDLAHRIEGTFTSEVEMQSSQSRSQSFDTATITAKQGSKLHATPHDALTILGSAVPAPLASPSAPDHAPGAHAAFRRRRRSLVRPLAAGHDAPRLCGRVDGRHEVDRCSEGGTECEFSGGPSGEPHKIGWAGPVRGGMCLIWFRDKCCGVGTDGPESRCIDV